MSQIKQIKTPDGTVYDIDAVTVNGHSVEKDVPDDALFTDENVTQTPTDEEDADYEVIFSGSADNNSATEGVRKSQGFKYNPSKQTAVLSGKMTVGVQPTEDMDVATKQYVDTLLPFSIVDGLLNISYEEE